MAASASASGTTVTAQLAVANNQKQKNEGATQTRTPPATACVSMGGSRLLNGGAASRMESDRKHDSGATGNDDDFDEAASFSPNFGRDDRDENSLAKHADQLGGALHENESGALPPSPLSPPTQTSRSSAYLQQTAAFLFGTPDRAQPPTSPITVSSPSQPLTQPTPQPAPPYWTHSRTRPQSHNLDSPPPATTSATPSKGATITFHSPTRPSPTSALRRSQAGAAIDTAPFSPEPPTWPAYAAAASSPFASAATSSLASALGGYPSHRRDTSTSSSMLNLHLITLQDNEAAETNDRGSQDAACSGVDSLCSGGSTLAPSGAVNAAAQRCWARRVELTSYVVVHGGDGGGGGINGGVGVRHLGAFVVWTIRVETLSGGAFCIHKRYSEFDTLRRRLIASFPQAGSGGALPPLPPKSLLGKFRPAFLEQRRLGLQYFLNCTLLNPEFAKSPVLQEFLFA